MPARRIDGFFYGLFMDRDVLLENQVSPENPRRAFVEDFQVRIGRRATLTPCLGARAYGVVFALTQAEIARLYAAPGLEAYYPEALLVRILEGDAVPAICYNLLEAPGADEANPDYAAGLRSRPHEARFSPRLRGLHILV